MKLQNKNKKINHYTVVDESSYRLYRQTDTYTNYNPQTGVT